MIPSLKKFSFAFVLKASAWCIRMWNIKAIDGSQRSKRSCPSMLCTQVGQQRDPPTRGIVEKVAVLQKVFFCICFEGIGLVYTHAEYQGHRIVATQQNSQSQPFRPQECHQSHHRKLPLVKNVFVRNYLEGISAVCARVECQGHRAVAAQ
jgi:hypothetical protein